jgi:hypothetical protein
LIPEKIDVLVGLGVPIEERPWTETACKSNKRPNQIPRGVHIRQGGRLVECGRISEDEKKEREDRGKLSCGKGVFILLEVPPVRLSACIDNRQERQQQPLSP